jgi:hypothetical protein
MPWRGAWRPIALNSYEFPQRSIFPSIFFLGNEPGMIAHGRHDIGTLGRCRGQAAPAVFATTTGVDFISMNELAEHLKDERFTELKAKLKKCPT